MAFRFSIQSRRVREMLRDAPDALSKWIARALEQHGQKFNVAMGRRFGATLSDGRNPTPGGFSGKLASRTGNLEGTIGYTVVGKRGPLKNLKLVYHVGDASTIKYAVTQEEGRVIVGRPWLAIPLPPNLTGTGRSRIERPANVRGKAGWGLIKSKKGNLLVVKWTADGFEPWWVLKKSVRVPARLGFERTVRSRAMANDRVKRVRNAIGRAMQEAAGRA